MSTTRMRKNLNESVQLVVYYCHQCKQQILYLSPLGRCSECNSEFIEEQDDDNRLADTRPQTSPQLPPTKRNNELLDKSIDNCSICLEAIGDNPKRLSCSHHFHALCIDPWLNTNITCPLCRKIVAKPKRTVASVSNGVTRQLIEYTIIQSMMRPLLVPEIRVTRRDMMAANNQRVVQHRRLIFGHNNEHVVRTRSQTRH